MWYILISVTLFLSPAFSLEDRWIEKESSIEIVNCSQTISNSGSGSLFLQFETKCDPYDILLKSTNATSIFHLKPTIQYIGNDKDSMQNESVSYTEKRNIKINIYERTVNQDGMEKNIPLAEWELRNMNENSTWTHQSYLSRTSRVKIQVEAQGVGLDYKLTFFYQEIKYGTNETNYSKASGEIKPAKTFEGTYRPNTVYIYRLDEVPHTNWSSTLITLDHLVIDTAMGEYLLIGAGNEILEGPQPLLISQPKSNSTYYVDDASAYVIFVSTSSQTNRSVKIRWEHAGVKISPDDRTPEDPLDALKSRPICFFNGSLALDGTNKCQEDGPFKNFCERFANLCRSYAEKNRLIDKENIQSLNTSSVYLYPMKIKSDSSSLLYATVQVKYQGKAILNWKQLGEIIDMFEINSSSMFGFTIGHCPTDVDDRKTWNFMMYLSVPVFGVFFLMIWAWRQNVFTQKCTSVKEEKFSSQQSSIIPVEPNLYEQTNTVPKLVEISEQGRRRTLAPEDSIQGNAEGGNATEVNTIDTAAIPSTSAEPVVITRQRLSMPQHKRRPSIQPLIQKDKDSSLALKIRKNESDHLYDSVSSEISTKETKL